VPREIREEARLEPGMRIVKKGRIRVAVPVEENEPLQGETVRRTTADVRRRRR